MEYVKKLGPTKLLERLADDLVGMHDEGAIDLSYWETAREVVERFYEVQALTIIGDKKDASSVG